MRPAHSLLLLLLCACSASVDVELPLEPLEVPATGIRALPVYAELAVDLPEEAQGDIIALSELRLDALVQNRSPAAELELSVRVSAEGEAEPGTVLLYPFGAEPEYFERAIVVLPSLRLAPASSQFVRVEAPASVQSLVGTRRVYVIVSNAIASLPFLVDPRPLELNVTQGLLRARLTKELDELDGAQHLGGL